MGITPCILGRKSRSKTVQGASVVANGGEAITLMAADYAFHANADTLTYGWSLASRPDGSAAVIDPADPSAQIVPGATHDCTPDQVGIYLIQLTAPDGVLAARPAVITVTVENTASTGRSWNAACRHQQRSPVQALNLYA